MIKILIFDVFRINLLNFHFLTNEKWYFYGGKILWSLFIITSTQFWMAKNGKIQDLWQSLHFLTNKKTSGSQKASELFWQAFTE